MGCCTPTRNKAGTVAQIYCRDATSDGDHSVRRWLILPAVLAIAADTAEPSLTPGHWDIIVVAHDLGKPEEPSVVQQEIAALMGIPPEQHICVTPEASKQQRSPWASNLAAKGCGYDRRETSGGKIDVKMSCKLGNASVKSSMTGSYGPDKYDLVLTLDGNDAGETGLAMQLSTSGRRSGECTGKEDK